MKSFLLFIASLSCIQLYSADIVIEKSAPPEPNPPAAKVTPPEKPQIQDPAILEAEKAAKAKVQPAPQPVDPQKALEEEKAKKALAAKKALEARKALEAKKRAEAKRKALEAKKRAEKAWKAKKALIAKTTIKEMGPFTPPVKGEMISFRKTRGTLVQGKFSQFYKNKVFIETQPGVSIGVRISDISTDDIWKFDKKQYDARIKKVIAQRIAKASSKRQLTSSLNDNKDKPAFASFNFDDSKNVTKFKISKSKSISIKDMEFEDVDPLKVYCETKLAGKACELIFRFNAEDQLKEVALYYEGHPDTDYDVDVKYDWETMRNIIGKRYKQATTTVEFPKIDTLTPERLTATDTWELKNKRISVGILFSALEYKSAIVIEDTSAPEPPKKAETAKEEVISDADKF